MTRIIIWEPRWHDRVVLVKPEKIGKDNDIIITGGDKDGNPYYPQPMYISGKRAMQFPQEDFQTKAGKTIKMIAIPLDELEKEQLDV